MMPPAMNAACTSGLFWAQVAATSAARQRSEAWGLPSRPSSVCRPPMVCRSAGGRAGGEC